MISYKYNIYKSKNTKHLDKMLGNVHLYGIMP